MAAQGPKQASLKQACGSGTEYASLWRRAVVGSWVPAYERTCTTLPVYHSFHMYVGEIVWCPACRHASRRAGLAGERHAARRARSEPALKTKTPPTTTLPDSLLGYGLRAYLCAGRRASSAVVGGGGPCAVRFERKRSYLFGSHASHG